MLVYHLTLRGRSTPEGYFGRITGIADVLGQLTSGLSLLWLGLALRFAGGRPAFAILGAAILVAGLAVALAPKPALSAGSS